MVNKYPLTDPVITTCVAIDNSVFGLSTNGFQLNVTYGIEQGDNNEVNFSNNNNNDYGDYSSNSSSMILPCILFILTTILLNY